MSHTRPKALSPASRAKTPLKQTPLGLPSTLASQAGLDLASTLTTLRPPRQPWHPTHSPPSPQWQSGLWPNAVQRLCPLSQPACPSGLCRAKAQSHKRKMGRAKTHSQRCPTATLGFLSRCNQWAPTRVHDHSSEGRCTHLCFKHCNTATDLPWAHGCGTWHWPFPGRGHLGC